MIFLISFLLLYLVCGDISYEYVFDPDCKYYLIDDKLDPKKFYDFSYFKKK